jgi:hypothetical protein
MSVRQLFWLGRDASRPDAPERGLLIFRQQFIHPLKGEDFYSV